MWNLSFLIGIACFIITAPHVSGAPKKIIVEREEFRAQAAPQTCGIFYRSEKKAFCSATWIGGSFLTTDAHCTFGNRKARDCSVRCPDGTRRDLKEWKRDPDYFEFNRKELGGKSLLPLASDRALITVEAPLDLKAGAARLVASDDELKTLLDNPSKCTITGWGLNRSGEQNEATAGRLSILAKTSVTLHTRRESRAAPGDSGGSLICLDSADKPVLVGLIRAKSPIGGSDGEIPFSQVRLLDGDARGWYEAALRGTNRFEDLSKRGSYLRNIQTETKDAQECAQSLQETQAALNENVLKALGIDPKNKTKPKLISEFNQKVRDVRETIVAFAKTNFGESTDDTFLEDMLLEIFSYGQMCVVLHAAMPGQTKPSSPASAPATTSESIPTAGALR